MDGASEGETGVGVAGTKLPVPGMAGAPGDGAATPADAPAVAGGTGTLASLSLPFTSRLMSLISDLPEGGALTTVGRRLCSLAASFCFCSSGNCWYAFHAF